LNILITGGAGFIGQNLYNLLKEKHDVTLVDNFSTSNIVDNIVSLDLSKHTIQIEELIRNTDVIYHLAGSVGVKKIDSEYHESLMNSVNINNVIFPLVERYQKKLIFASTSEVYGECTDAKESDTCQISSPEFGRGSYSCAKLMSEFILKSYTFPSVICRFFNVVGKGQLADFGMVIPNFVKSAKANRRLIIHNDGAQVRSFCDISDAVIMLEMLLDDVHNGEIYNIGNSENEISMLDLACKIINMCDSNSEIFFRDTKEVFSKQFFEINKRTVCTDKFDEYYKAQQTLDEIIASVI
jgi:UDP-glucose 4-epimerase